MDLTLLSLSIKILEFEFSLSLCLSLVFFNAHIKPHIDYASVVWDGCRDVLKKRLNSLHRRAVKLILPDTILTTAQKLKEMRIMSLQKQLSLTHSCAMPVCI